MLMITDQVQNKILKIKKTKGLCTHRSYKKYIPVVLTILTMYGLFYLCVCVDVHLCVCYLFTLVWMCAHEYKGKCACICKLWASTFLCLPSVLGLHMYTNLPHFHVGSGNSNSCPHVCTVVILGRSYLMSDFSFLCACEISFSIGVN